MKASAVTSKSQTTVEADKPPSKNLSQVRREEEPPSYAGAIRAPAEEPPSKIHSSRYTLFGNIADSAWNDWKWHFRNRITTVEELARFIPITSEERARLNLVTKRYPLSITPHYLSLIDPDDPDDPIRKQAIPSILEITTGAMGQEDPLEEKENSVVPGLVHRYPDRALMVITNICPMLCRHCTRKREWRSGGWIRTSDEIGAMVDYIRQHPSIRDVIISGGDPLTLSTHLLEDIIARIRRISHVEIIRIGTRCPVVLPQRVDDELCSMLSRYGPIWLNTHFNHPREITREAAEACDRLMRSGVPVNNQSVLLRGINDTAETQMKLCHGLLRIKVRPYYLFQCDEVQGTEHLRTPVEVGIKIIEAMRGYTSGLAVPTFVVDLSGGGGKVPLQPNYVLAQTEEELLVKNYEGNIFHYRNPRPQACPESMTAATSPVVSRITSQVSDREPQPESVGVTNADRVIVRS